MSYTRLHWVESETPLSAQNMNNIEDGIEELQSQKVDKVSGKALSDNNYTAAEKTKLAGIAEGAEVNVQSDWNQTSTSADDYIKNKPDNATTSSDGFMSAADKSKLNGIAAGAQVNRTYTAVTGKPTAAASPGFGGTVTVSQVAQDANGQVSVTDRTITIPNNEATAAHRGLMSAADKAKLDVIKFEMIKLYATEDVTVAAGATARISYKVDAVTAGKYLYAIPGWFSYPSGVALTGFQASYTSSLKLDSINVWVTSLRSTVTISRQSYPIGAFFIGEDVS